MTRHLALSILGLCSLGLLGCPAEDADEDVEICWDLEDNDGDGAVDCHDDDCAELDRCYEVCSDGLDNDGDEAVDCADDDCVGDVACAEVCDDEVDNDLDELMDCADPDCALNHHCVEDCDDDIDNDLDEAIDCEDTDCAGDVACLEDCNDEIDNDLDTKTDCDDTDCLGFADCLPELDEVAPLLGLEAGGESVDLYGAGFAWETVGTTVVHFDGLAATDVVVVDDGHITATTPAHLRGVVEVTVGNAHGQVNLLRGFEYYREFELYFMCWEPGEGEGLWAFDVETTTAEVVVQLRWWEVRDLAFAPDGTLYGMGYSFFGGDSELVTIDPSTGSVTPVGYLQDSDGNWYSTYDLAFIGGKLYGLDYDYRSYPYYDYDWFLFEIDTATAEVVNEIRTGPSNGYHYLWGHSLLEAPDGTVYVLSDEPDYESSYVLDLTTPDWSYGPDLTGDYDYMGGAAYFGSTLYGMTSDYGDRDRDPPSFLGTFDASWVYTELYELPAEGCWELAARPI